ncbi:MAG: DUF2911 domain-containing protein [Cytophagales bacterium]|nr:DUF2911 domain-containing protein [Cytophagales bacterium]
MKRVLMLFAVALSVVTQAQVQTPAASTAGAVSTVVGLTDISVEYSRPKVKGRKIFGTGPEYLEQFGKIWRTGANSGTTITFSDDVKFGGSDVPKGKYLVLTIPGATEWTVILYKDVAMGGNVDAYDQTKDQARAVVKSAKLTEKVETFTVQVSDLSEDNKTANLHLSWDNVSVKVPIVVDFDTKVMKSIEANTKVNPNNLYNAASYYLDNGKDLKMALEWVTAAVAARPDAYWMSHTKAKIQKALGDKKGAMESATASKAAAEKGKNDAYVKMNNELMAGLK